MTVPPGATGALATGAWFALLWYAAPLLSRSKTMPIDVAARLRDAIVLGTAIPFALALCGMLLPWTTALALAAVAIARTIVRPPRGFRAERPIPLATRFGYALPVSAIVATSWPALARPIMQGDSLLYHLPNAAIWSASHHAYGTTTPFWWYPCGSEMFAAGILEFGGPLESGLAGTVASLLLALRLMAWSRQYELGPLQSGALIAAVMTVPLVALQGPSLENDVWLAAWLLEIVWAARFERDATARSIALTALVKPNGWLFALIAAVAGRVPIRTLALGAIAPAIWAVRTVALLPHAVVHPRSNTVPLFPTTILAQGWTGATTFVQAFAIQGFGLTALAIALGATLLFTRDAALRAVAIATAAFFFVEPFAFRDASPQLASGESLRYLFPALTLGVAGLTAIVAPLLRRPAMRVPGAIAFASLAAVAVWQISVVDGIFASDSNTRDAPVAALAVLVAALVPFAAVRPALTFCLGLAMLARLGTLAASHPLEYYDAAIAAPGAAPSHLYEWLAAAKPRAAVVFGFRIGSVAAATPSTLVSDALVSNSCDEARDLGAVLIVGGGIWTGGSTLADRTAYGLRCGTVMYRDASTLVVAPGRRVSP